MNDRAYKRGWKAKIERGEATYESLCWQEFAREEWEAMPAWEKAVIGLVALLLPFAASIV